MKYIKRFEDNKISYNIGDYVLLDMQSDYDYDDCLSKIVYIDVDNKGIYYDDAGMCVDVNPYPIVVQFYDGVGTFDIDERTILRKMTDSEIEYFNNIKDTKKYNL